MHRHADGRICRKFKQVRLTGVAGRADEFAEDGYVGPVHADATGVDWKTETFGLIQTNASVIKFRKTVALCRSHTIQPGRIHRPGRTMPAPRAARQFVKLLPIAFLPGRHSYKSLRALRTLFDYICAIFKFPVFNRIVLVIPAHSKDWMLSFHKRFQMSATARTVLCEACYDFRQWNDTAEAVGEGIFLA